VTDIVRHAKQILRDAGYVVIPRERHVVLTQAYRMSKYEMEYSKFNAEAIRDCANHTMLRAIGPKLHKDGLLIKTVREEKWPEPIYEMRMQVAVIKPRDE
jgi:hypothetical protein